MNWGCRAPADLGEALSKARIEIVGRLLRVCPGGGSTSVSIPFLGVCIHSFFQGGQDRLLTCSETSEAIATCALPRVIALRPRWEMQRSNGGGQ